MPNGPAGPIARKKNEKGKGKGVGEQDLGSEREREWNSGNDLRRNAYFTGHDIGR